MGFDVHITRANDWAHNKDQEISAEEWLHYVEEDNELARDPQNGDYAAVWVDRARCPEAWLDWFEGNIYTTNPDQQTLAKMLRVASDLRARVQGDDGKAIESVEDVPS